MAFRMHARTEPSDDTYVLDDQIGFILRLAVQFHTAIFTSRMVENLTQTQFATLAKIEEIGSCSQSDLGRLLMLDSATVNGVVDRMKSRDLIAITDDPADRRRQSLSLTAEGRRVVQEAEAVARGITTETLAQLTPTEQARLVQLLRKMIANGLPEEETRAAPVRLPARGRRASAAGAKGATRRGA
ncbi:MAG: MarR family transcriptional regulator [Rhizobiales bacterium]|nr:MarR family transcriptional regulator [Hyphomicrobiales bacterium]